MRESVKKWVVALRSGEYSQTKGQLKDETGFCCLGVACDLYEKETGNQIKDDDGFYGLDYDDQNLSGPYQVVKEWLGLRTEKGSLTLLSDDRACLTEMNDRGKTFEELADVIESEQNGHLFVTEGE